MPTAWPSLRSLVQPLLGAPYAQYDCWALASTLFKAGWNLDLLSDAETIPREVVEVWFRGDPRPVLALVQPWDCVLMTIHGLVGDHLGLVVEGTTMVHTRQRTGVVLEPLQRWQSRILQLSRLRRLL